MPQGDEFRKRQRSAGSQPQRSLKRRLRPKPRLRRKLRGAMRPRFRPFSRLNSPVSSVSDSSLAARLDASRQELLDLGILAFP